MTMQQAIFAGGCFWCTEAVFNDIAGVDTVESGYIGGTNADPTYKQICSGTTGHAEAIKITFDETQVSYADLLDIFFATHDPTQLNRQGGDIGTQYRSAIFLLDEDQRAETEAGIVSAAAQHSEPVVTTIEGPAIWYAAEDYHQQYWADEGRSNPYCIATIPPKLQKLRTNFADKLKEQPSS